MTWSEGKRRRRSEEREGRRKELKDEDEEGLEGNRRERARLLKEKGARDGFNEEPRRVEGGRRTPAFRGGEEGIHEEKEAGGREGGSKLGRTKRRGHRRKQNQPNPVSRKPPSLAQ